MFLIKSLILKVCLLTKVIFVQQVKIIMIEIKKSGK